MYLFLVSIFPSVFVLGVPLSASVSFLSVLLCIYISVLGFPLCICLSVHLSAVLVLVKDMVLIEFFTVYIKVKFKIIMDLRMYSSMKEKKRFLHII